MNAINRAAGSKRQRKTPTRSRRPSPETKEAARQAAAKLSQLLTSVQARLTELERLLSLPD